MQKRRTLLRMVVAPTVLAWTPSAVVAQSGQADLAPAATVHRLASEDTTLRIMISVAQRRLWVVDGASDTLLRAPVAVGSQRSMRYAGHVWTFTTPIGVQTVLGKEANPVWIPPDWHFVEVARKQRLALVWLRGDTTVALADGASLTMEHTRVRIETDSTRIDVDGGGNVVVGKTLFVPPVGSPNRRMPGELGKYRLDLGDGVGIHGTPDQNSVGRAVTHGCMRLHDDDIEWLYEHIPVGTRVYVY